MGTQTKTTTDVGHKLGRDLTPEPLDRLIVAALRDLSREPGTLLQRMIVHFLDEAPARLAEVRGALDEEDFPAAARAARRLKAAGALMGAIPLAVVAARIERSAWATAGAATASYADAAALELDRALSAARRLQS